MKYEVNVRRDGEFWLIQIPALDGVTQAERLEDVEMMARDYIATVTDSDKPVELTVTQID